MPSPDSVGHDGDLSAIDVARCAITGKILRVLAHDPSGDEVLDRIPVSAHVRGTEGRDRTAELVDLARPAVVRAAPILACASKLGLPSASPRCCDEEPFHLRSIMARLATHTFAGRRARSPRVDPNTAPATWRCDHHPR